jgi:hypothetical protein
MNLYQLLIELENSPLPIWRRIIVDGETPFDELHELLQISMGWESAHLYEYQIGSMRICDFELVKPEISDELIQECMDTTLDDLQLQPKSKFFYHYDFGDSWIHKIVVEKISSDGPEEWFHPKCLAGKGACPPEDCGGTIGYERLLHILKNPAHAEYSEMRNWIGHDWDADHFSVGHTNAELLDYSTKLQDYYYKAAELLSKSRDEINLTDKSSEDTIEAYNYNEILELEGPEDILKHSFFSSIVTDLVDSNLQNEESIENETIQKIDAKGYSTDEAISMLYGVKAVEVLYELKYDIDQIETRYNYNLQKLPEKPTEIPTSAEAFYILQHCRTGVPFAAIDYLRQNRSKENENTLLELLNIDQFERYEQHYVSNAPLWLGIVAEEYLSTELIDIVISWHEQDFIISMDLLEQSQILIEMLGEKYPEETAKSVISVMKKDIEKPSRPNIHYLFDGLFFCDPELITEPLMEMIQNWKIRWYEQLVIHIADLQLDSALPLLKDRLLALKAKRVQDIKENHLIVEIEEAIGVLRGDIELDERARQPWFLSREYNWREMLEESEEYFYPSHNEEREDFDSGALYNLLAQNMISPASEPRHVESKPNRNDPCPCGSGKKYKKCCMP